MGFITTITPKKINFSKKEIFTIYSIGLYSFLAGPIGTFLEKSEFRQIEKILDIDLSILIKDSVNSQPATDKEIYQLYLAEENNNYERAEYLKKIIKEKELQWEKDFDSKNEGWIEIKELLNVVEKYYGLIKENPIYYKEIEFNIDWKYYFIPMSEISNKSLPNKNRLQYWKKLDLDLMELHFYANMLSSFGYKYMRISSGHTGGN